MTTLQIPKGECLTQLILFGDEALSRALHEYVEHYHYERNHQGKGQALLRLWDTPAQCTPEDVDILLRAINQDKRPVRFAGIFDQENQPR